MNLILWFIISIFILLIFAVIANSSPTGLAHIQFQFDAMNCPFPIATGQDQLILDGEIAFGMNVTHNLTNGTDYGTKYTCEFDPLSGPDGATVFTANYKDYQATAGWGTVPIGWFTYAQDWLTTASSRIIAFFTLLAFFLTPINFNIMGFTLTDLSGIAVMIIIGLYGFCYIGIGAFIATYVVGLVNRLI